MLIEALLRAYTLRPTTIARQQPAFVLLTLATLILHIKLFFYVLYVFIFFCFATFIIQYQWRRFRWAQLIRLLSLSDRKCHLVRSKALAQSLVLIQPIFDLHLHTYICRNRSAKVRNRAASCLPSLSDRRAIFMRSLWSCVFYHAINMYFGQSVNLFIELVQPSVTYNIEVCTEVCACVCVIECIAVDFFVSTDLLFEADDRLRWRK